MSKQDIKILSDVEHCLLRPGMYIGSTKVESQNFWVLEDNKMTLKEVKYIPGLYKIFCEILDNALDEYIRGFGNKIDVYADYDENKYTIKDHARGIPISLHKDAKIPTPEVVFTKLRSGSNFDDSDRTTIGMNGVGASLTTVFSTFVEIDICRDGKQYTQRFLNNLETIEKAKIKSKTGRYTGTSVTFIPDKKIFAAPLPQQLVIKRCLELSVAYPDLKINLCIKQNGQETPYEFKYSFEEFVNLFDTESSIFVDKKANIRLAVCHNKISENFEHFQNINGADTFRGGTFIDCLKETFASNLREKIKKEYKLDVTNSDICKNVLIIHFQTWNAPQFEGQTKEKFVNDKKEVQAFVNQIFTPRKTTSIVNNLPGLKEYIKDFVILKNDRKDMLELKKVQKNIGRQKIPKLISASSNNRMECSIYITEGDSAISNLAMVRNSRTMAGIPLRGKVLNVYEMNAKDIVSNKEIQSLMNAIGLQVGEKATPKTLNYGKIIIATDQDMDGYCIRCLIVNFLYKYWPELFEHERVHILESPLYEVINNKSKDTQYFYNKADFMEFMKNKNASSFEIAYFKGLGSCGKEAWDYMINTAPHMIKITDIGKSKESLKLAFGEDSDNRKEWLK